MAQVTYKFHPSSDSIYHYNPVTGGYDEAMCYQVEFKQYRRPNNAAPGLKHSYLIVLKNSTKTLKVTENELFVSPGVPQALAPYEFTYEFEPEEDVWVADRKNTAVKFGTVYQTEIKIHKDVSTDASNSHGKVSYYVSFNDNSGTTISQEGEVFSSVEAAWLYLGIDIGPTPTLPPDTTPTPTPLPVAGNAIRVSKVNGDASGSYYIVPGTPVSVTTGSDTTVIRVSSDPDFVGATHPIYGFLGFVYPSPSSPSGIGRGEAGEIITEGTINMTVDQWNDVILDVDSLGNVITSDGLTTGARYYISNISGKLTKVPPRQGYSKQVGIAASKTELDIRIGHTIKL